MHELDPQRQPVTVGLSPEHAGRVRARTEEAVALGKAALKFIYENPVEKAPDLAESTITEVPDHLHSTQCNLHVAQAPITGLPDRLRAEK